MINICGVEFYEVEDVAKELGFGIETIRIHLRNGTLKGKKHGNRWIIKKEEIEKAFKKLIED